MRMLEKNYDILMQRVPVEIRADMPAVNISQSAKWFLEENEQDYWDFREDFPTIVSPFPFAWYEYEMPKCINKNGVKTNIPLSGAHGHLVASIQISPDKGIDAIKNDMPQLAIEGVARSTGRPHGLIGEEKMGKQQRVDEALAIGKPAKWITFSHYLVDLGERNSRLFPNAEKGVVDMGVVVDILDEDGRPFTTLTREVPFVPIGMYMHIKEHTGASLQSALLPLYFSISLMHCKNVDFQDNPVPEKVRRKRDKKGNKSIEFRTLIVNSVRRASSSGGNSASSIPNAMHFVRGHFKDYRDGAGLFGKHKDVYWWETQARGSQESGTIIKDYEVKSA